MAPREREVRAAEGPPEPRPNYQLTTATNDVGAQDTCTALEVHSDEWRDIPGYEGYQATRDGRIRSVRRTIEDRNGMAKRLQSVELVIDSRVTLSALGRRRSISVRALVAAAFEGEAG